MIKLFLIPINTVSAFEKKSQIPRGTISKAVMQTGETGAWSLLEKGLISQEDFAKKFGQECEQVVNDVPQYKSLRSSFLSSILKF